jgi:hypothetical protein
MLNSETIDRGLILSKSDQLPRLLGSFGCVKHISLEGLAKGLVGTSWS